VRKNVRHEAHIAFGLLLTQILELSRRVIKFDASALAKEAANAVGATECVKMERFAEGARFFVLFFGD
jgi:hypothetical protein